MYPEKLKTSFLKWIFTWNIAMFPIYIGGIKDLIFGGGSNIFSDYHDEMIIVSLVMVTEPLWELIQIKKKGVLMMFLFMVNFLFILLATTILVLTVVDTDGVVKSTDPTLEKFILFSKITVCFALFLGIVSLLATHSTETKKPEQ